jgi:modulator of FtsH protease HflC
MKRRTLIAVLVIIIGWLLTSLYTVDVSEFAYVTRFGSPIATHDGQSAAGLHVKAPWPIDSVLRIERRLQSFDLPSVESLTRDAVNRTVDKTIAADAFVVWQIAEARGVDRFVKTLGTFEQAKRILTPQLTGRLAAAIGTMPLSDLIGVIDPAGQIARSERFNTRLDLAGLATRLREEYGIELIEFRVRRWSYPEAVQQSIFDRIRSERGRKVAEYESEGARLASDIQSQAEKDARTIEAEARATKIRLEGAADAKADAIRNEAHARDRDFYAFLQKLKSYRQMFGDTRDVLLLSSKHPLFDLLLNPPAEPKK